MRTGIQRKRILSCRPIIGAAALAGFTIISIVPLAMAQERYVDEVLVLRNASKLDGELGQLVLETPRDARLRVAIVLKDQADRQVILGARRPGVSKEMQRLEVVDTLKGVAARSQGPILTYLEQEQRNGNVGDWIRSLWIHNVVGIEATPEVILAIADRDDVEYVHWDRPVGDEVLLDDHVGRAGGPGIAELECGVDVMDADRVWNELNITGEGVVVCVVDTGLCITHPDIQNQVWVNTDEVPNNGQDDDGNGFIDDINGWNFESNNNNISDQNGHGSHVSGTVAGDGTQGTQSGVAPDAKIMMSKFWNSFSGEQSVWDGMQYAVDNDADVITASLGWPHSFSPDRVTWRTVCENSIAAGVVVIYASGNEGCGNPPDNVRTPGDVPDVLTIGATDCNDNIAGFSSCGPITWQDVPEYNDCPFPPGCIKPDVSAPGVSTKSHNICSGYWELSGTSMATPHVAGAVALMLEANPNLDHFDVKRILEDTAIDLGVSGKDNTFGSGRVDAYAAVLAASGSNNPCLEMQVKNLVAGEQATFSVTGKLEPGQKVAILFGFGGNGTHIENYKGYCSSFGFHLPVDAARSRLVGEGLAGANSEYSTARKVGSNLSGTKILFQATKHDTCPDDCMSEVWKGTIR